MPNSSEEAMGLRDSARGRPLSATASPGTRQWGRAARQKAVLLVLLAVKNAKYRSSLCTFEA